MFAQYGKLWPTNGWDPFGTLGQPSKFQRVSHLAFSYIGSVTAWHSSSGRKPNCGMVQGMELRNFRRGRHRYSTGWPSRWALAHIVVYYITYIDVDIEATACAHTADMIRLRPNFWPRLWPQVEVNILALSEAVARMLRRRTMLQGLGRDRGQYSGLG